MWLVRATKEVITRASPATMFQRFGVSFVNAQGQPVSNEVCIYNPDLTAVTGQPTKYWELSGDTIGLMDAGERAAVDAALLAAELQAIVNAFDNPKDYARAIALVLLDSYLMTRGRVNALLDAIDAATTLANLKTAVAAINNLPDVSPSQLKDAILAKLGV